MRLTLVCLAVVVAVVAVEGVCHNDAGCADLTCHPGYVGTCIYHKCSCEHPDGAKRDGGCTSDTECAGTDCTDQPGDTPFCNHHGLAEHGHSNCDCR